MFPKPPGGEAAQTPFPGFHPLANAYTSRQGKLACIGRSAELIGNLRRS